MNKLPQNSNDCKIALIYDRVTTQYGGAEKVLVALSELYPNADLHTSVYNQQKATWAKSLDVIPTWLQKIPFAKQHHRWLLPLLPIAFESIDLSSYDIIISITSAEAKGVITLPHQLHICYLLTPTRYLYSHQQTYIDSAHKKNPVLGFITSLIFKYVSWWDISASARPDAYIPISKLVANRLKKYYQRLPSAIVYPPVEELALSNEKSNTIFENYYLVVSRLVPYKRIDLVIQATQKLDRKLIVVGDGPEKKHIQDLIVASLKPQNITLLSSQSQQNILSLMKNATALVMPGIEDFGITPLEALTQNTPSVIHAKSGVAELIKNNSTGIHLQELTVNGLIEALEQIESTTFSIQEMKKVVSENNTNTFKKNIQQVITTLWKEHYVKYT